MKKIIFIALGLVFSTYSFAQNATPSKAAILESDKDVKSVSQYKVANKFHLDGDMGWDYVAVDESSNRLYVSHGNMVQVLDLKNGGKVIGTIGNLNGVHGIALADDLNKGFITSGRDSSVAIFDLKTLVTITKFKVTGAGPDAILYDKFSQRVFTFNGRTSNSTVIDAKTNAIVGTIELPGRPEFAVADGNGKIYDNLEDKSMICVINSTSMKVENTWSLAPGDGPSGLAIDVKSRRLFSVCDNKMMVIMNADNGKIITTVPIGEHPDAAGFDVSVDRAYSSNGDGTLTVVKEDAGDKFTLLENVTTQKGARTCAVNSITHHIYLPTAEFGAAPKPTPDKPKPRPSIVPNSFQILDVELVK